MQIRNYLSQIYDVKSALLIVSSKEWINLAAYLSQAKCVDKIYCINSEENLIEPEYVEKCTIDKVIKQGLKVDLLLFDRKSKEVVQLLQSVHPRYLVGKMDHKEEYFNLWEQYREISDYIYIEKEKIISPKEQRSDANECEILDWVKGQQSVELSVILPVYNVEDYLPRCIETLTAWKAAYVEFLFINDWSTDNSAEIIRKYMQRDSRIHLLNKENGGCASARNRGIEVARGKYLGFVDPDDFIDESMFYKLFKRILLGNFDFAYCGYQEFYEQTGKSQEIQNDCLQEPYLSGTYRADKVQKLVINTRVAIWRGIYKKEVLDRNHIRFHEDLRRFDDLPFRVEFLFKAQSAVCVPEFLYYYRLGREGQDVACSDEGFFVHFEIFRHLDEFVDQMKDSRMMDLLQVVKIHTHGFALSRIADKKKRQEYLCLARKQMDRNMGYFRTICLILMYTGKRNLGWYTKIKWHLP